MEIFGYFSAILIGILLGLIGGGGSILTVPVLVYLLRVDPVLATTYSLFIVGSTSLVGGLMARNKKQVDFKSVTEFGIPSIFTVFITRQYILPAIPEQLFTIGHIQITKGIFLMVIFAILMLLSSFSMIIDANKPSKDLLPGKKTMETPLVLIGLFTGLVTGLLGAGGGFLIIPTLVLFVKLPMKTAVGTSLWIISINSLFGFLFSLHHFSLNWTLLIIFAGMAMIGIFIGSSLGKRVSADSLKKVFGWILMVMAVFIILKELYLK